MINVADLLEAGFRPVRKTPPRPLNATDRGGRYNCRVGTEPSAVAPGQMQDKRPPRDFDAALPRSVRCLLGIISARKNGCQRWQP